MAYAENHLEHECFPQTLLFVEGTRGSISFADYWVALTAENGTLARRYPPTMFSWCDPQYAVVQSSIVACHTTPGPRPARQPQSGNHGRRQPAHDAAGVQELRVGRAANEVVTLA